MSSGHGPTQQEGGLERPELGVALCGCREIPRAWGPPLPAGSPHPSPGTSRLGSVVYHIVSFPQGRPKGPEAGEGAQLQAFQFLTTSGELKPQQPGRLSEERPGGCRGQDKNLRHLSSLRPQTPPTSCSLPEDLGLNFALPPSSCAETSQAGHLSEPQFPHLENRSDNSYLLG